MLSGKLVHMIESHWDPIMNRVIEQVRHEPQMSHIKALVESELRDWGQTLLQNLGHWLDVGSEEDLSRRYEQLGRLRFEEDVPLHESVHALCIIREKVVDFVEEHIFSKNILELYAEEELERRLGRFFDLLTVHMVRGYEQALHKAHAAAAHSAR
jgi:hypothetical protein